MTALLSTALAVGIVAGLVTGGHFRNLWATHLDWVWLLMTGAVVQTLVLDGVIPLHGAPQTAVLLASYVALASFGLLNLGRSGMGILFLGVMFNFLPIAFNGGMPVEAHAIVASGLTTAPNVQDLNFGPKHHLATKADHLRALDDTFPDWINHQIISLGDLTIMLGVATVVAGLLRGSEGVRRKGAERLREILDSDGSGVKRGRGPRGGHFEGGGAAVPSGGGDGTMRSRGRISRAGPPAGRPMPDPPPARPAARRRSAIPGPPSSGSWPPPDRSRRVPVPADVLHPGPRR
jgi:hypothetical protein